MAPKTPQANSKLPKPPSAGGPIPLPGIPAPMSVLQRRSFMPTPGGSSVSRTLKDMTPEQQALLAEAISMHSPGLIDPLRKPTAEAPTAKSTELAVGSALRPEQGLGMITPTALGFSAPQHNHRPASPIGITDRASPTGLASPASYRAPTSSQPSQIGSRASSSRLGTHAETLPAPHPSTQSTLANTSQQFSRPVSYSGMAPLSISSPNLPSMSSSSPTTPVGASRPPSGSPSGSRPTLPSSRLSAGPGARLSLVKQPLFQRPSGTAAPAARIPLSTVPGSPAIAPPSLDNYEIGDRVIVESMALSGYLRFLGPAEFKSGTWAGIELDTPTGKNDGSVGGVVYFHCRPKCGIFVLAAKIAKSELLFPSLPELTPARPPSAQEVAPALPTPTVSHAAQAASKITAGSRASKYIGMTATQLKQRNGPQPTTPSRLSTQGQSNLPGASLRAASPTVRARNGPAESPTAARTIMPGTGTATARANSPSPASKPLFRSSSPTTRPGPGARLSQPTAKLTLASLNSKSAAHSRSTSSTSSVTSQSSANGSRTRTSPTPRTATTPRRLSSRSGTPDIGNIISPNESRSNLLDQAAVIQMAGSPVDNTSLQLQQLQLDFEAAIAENNLLKSEMNETKSQLEMNRLLEKNDISYEERAFLSKSLGREAIDERLAQELQDLHAMKAVWDKERAAKDQELKVVTDKMTQVWLDAARSQKERSALLQERTDLLEKVEKSQQNGDVDVNLGSSSFNQEQQVLIESLQKSLQEADEKTIALESRLQDLAARTIEEEEKVSKANEDNKAANDAKVSELEAERSDMQAKLHELKATSQAVAAEMESKLKEAQEEASMAKLQWEGAQNKLDDEARARHQEESETGTKLRAVEVELQETQMLLAKSEKSVRGLEDKEKEYKASIAKRDQDIAGLKLELQDIAGMVQSEEVDRMRKVWELEKKRLEEAVADNITVMTALRDDIIAMESNEEELLATIKTLETSEYALKDIKAAAESESAQLQQSLRYTEEAFAQERSTLEARITESASILESSLAETKTRFDELEAIALSVEEWRERCEAMQLEMIQKTAAVEDLGLELAEAQTLEEALKKENEDIKVKLEEKASVDQVAALDSSRAEIVSLEEEREQLLVKVSELEAALTLSASAPRAASSGGANSEVMMNRTELEEEIAALKQMIHELTAENASVASNNKKLMQEHDILMEAHKHVETECLKLMDEVERLHSESLAVTSIAESDGLDKSGMGIIHIGTEAKTPLIGQEELKAALNNVTVLTKDNAVLTPVEKQLGQSQSASVVRLENLLKDKQAILDRLTQAHALEMRDLRQRYVELDRTKGWEVSQLNKELTELESLIESKIFHEADLEEEVQKKQKQIDRLQHEVSDLKSQLMKLTNGSYGSTTDLPPNGLSSGRRPSSSGANGVVRTPAASRTVSNSTDKTLFCEICEEEGHDLINCVAVFGGGKSKSASAPSNSTTPAPAVFSEAEMEDDRPYCENCEEFGDHYTDECPNESLT
ncbi:CAP-Gly domain-containing linker protein 4, partial [Dissophora ornata]